MNELHRTTEFVMSEVQAPSDTPVLFVRLSDGYLSLAKLEDIQALIAEAHAKIARQEEELRIVAAQRQDRQAQLAEARALAESFNAEAQAAADDQNKLRAQLAEAAVRIRYLEGYEDQYKLEHEQLGAARALLEAAHNEMWSADRETPDFYRRRASLTDKIRAFLLSL